MDRRVGEMKKGWMDGWVGIIIDSIDRIIC